jgi:hypothetical protein
MLSINEQLPIVLCLAWVHLTRGGVAAIADHQSFERVTVVHNGLSAATWHRPAEHRTGKSRSA